MPSARTRTAFVNIFNQNSQLKRIGRNGACKSAFALATVIQYAGGAFLLAGDSDGVDVRVGSYVTAGQKEIMERQSYNFTFGRSSFSFYPVTSPVMVHA